MCPETTNPYCVLNSICSCPPGHFLRDNEAANVAVPRDVKGKCNIPDGYTRWEEKKTDPSNLYIHSYNIYRPYTLILCQQICEQGQQNGVAVEARSFSISNGTQYYKHVYDDTGSGEKYQCICSTKVACDIDTNPGNDPEYTVNGFQTYDWTGTVLNECIKCKCTRFSDCCITPFSNFFVLNIFLKSFVQVTPGCINQNLVLGDRHVPTNVRPEPTATNPEQFLRVFAKIVVRVNGAMSLA
jgi:hypothetical protein